MTSAIQDEYLSSPEAIARYDASEPRGEEKRAVEAPRSVEAEAERVASVFGLDYERVFLALSKSSWG